MAKRKSHKSAKTSVSLFLKTQILLVLGLILVIIPVLFYVNEDIQLRFFTPHVNIHKSAYPQAVKITIPKVNLNLNIEETAINNGNWQVARNAASHLNISANPGEAGTIILYGHNTTEMFGPIRWLNKGDKIEVKTKDGKTHTYKITDIKEVNPEDTKILVSQKGETLILYTCSGFADLKRYIVIAKLN